MITKKDLGWGSYRDYSGFYFWGRHHYSMPASPRSIDLLYAVAMATEGGCTDSFNGYDSCGWSLGRYQVTELCSDFKVSALLGDVMENCPFAMDELNSALDRTEFGFAKIDGRWGFTDKTGPLRRSAAASRRLYSGNSDGKTWTYADKEHAASFIVPLINIWDYPEAGIIQDAFMQRRLPSFVMADVRNVFYYPDIKELGAAKAAMVSFSLNRATSAAAMWKLALGTSKFTPGSPDWLIDVVAALTFGPGIGIYPQRYEDIAPLLNRLYGVDLPLKADALHALRPTIPLAPVAPVGLTTAGIQAALLKLGYDLGPAGADGKMGPKTKAAIKDFQSRNSLTPDGVVGPLTAAALSKV
jgi:hypothetical protein